MIFNYDVSDIRTELLNKINSVGNIVLVTQLSDLSGSENHFLSFNANVTVGGVTIPTYSKGVLVASSTADANLYAIDVSGNLYVAFRNGGNWVNGKSINQLISDEATARANAISSEATTRASADTSINNTLATFTVCKNVSALSDFGNTSFNFSTSADVTLTPTSLVVPTYTKGTFITTGTDAALFGYTSAGKLLVAYRNGSNWVAPLNVTDSKMSIAPDYTGATDINSVVQAAISRMQANSSALSNKLFSFLCIWQSGQVEGYFGTSAFNVLCKFSSANYGYGLLISDNSNNIASFRVSNGTVSFFKIGDLQSLQTQKTITPSRASGISSSVNFAYNYCRQYGKLVTYSCSLTSATSSDVTVNHPDQIITGLPKPDGNLIFMAETYRATTSSNNRKPYRVQLNTDGTITAYWDAVVIPKNGEALMMNITYITND